MYIIETNCSTQELNKVFKLYNINGIQLFYDNSEVLKFLFVFYWDFRQYKWLIIGF